jgi:FixJ family two-component response regulator
MPPRPLIGIVDDDADMPAALSSLVRSLGYGAECFTSAQQLLDRQDLEEFSCVISDIHMPMMDGLELARRLSELATGLPVILMTGRSEPGLKEQAYSSGAMSFVTKPFSFEDLSDNLHKALEAKR